MRTADVQLLRPPAVPVAQRVIGCRFLGVVMLTNPDRPSERIELEVYFNPTNGQAFGLDAEHTAAGGQRLSNFMNPDQGGVLDVSDEPSGPLQTKTVRFLEA